MHGLPIIYFLETLTNAIFTISLGIPRVSFFLNHPGIIWLLLSS